MKQKIEEILKYYDEYRLEGRYLEEKYYSQFIIDLINYIQEREEKAFKDGQNSVKNNRICWNFKDYKNSEEYE